MNLPKSVNSDETKENKASMYKGQETIIKPRHHNISSLYVLVMEDIAYISIELFNCSFSFLNSRHHNKGETPTSSSGLVIDNLKDFMSQLTKSNSK